jgi:hypothetical protein
MILTLILVFTLVYFLWKVGAVKPSGIFPQFGGAPADPQTAQLSGNAPFASIRHNVGNGVKGSYANMINGPDPTKQKINPTKVLLPTYYGHGIPLAPNMLAPGPLWGQSITPHHLNAKCSPECCPSPYSCDHGCLCVDQQGLRKSRAD